MGTFTNKENEVRRKGHLIFVITGTQEPFDRMVKIIDKWAVNQENFSVMAQIAKSNIRTKGIQCFDFLEPDEFSKVFNQADIIISHAGMGAIIKAIENSKKIIIFPRHAKYGEHRNDHQIHTARNFDNLGYVNVAYSENDLLYYLSKIEELKVLRNNSYNADDSLITAISEFIENF